MTQPSHVEPARNAATRAEEPGLVGAFTIVAMTIIAFFPAFRAGFIWDDESYVEHCLPLRDPDGLKQIWLTTTSTPQYYPMVFTTFWLEYRLWGLNPAGYHVVNVLLHAASACLLWLVLRRLAVPGAWLAAALFALHPVQVESVAWITERKNVLSGFFFLAALLAYLRFALHEQSATRPWRFYLLALLLYAAALLSKTVTCSLPAVLVVLLWWKRDRLRAGDLLPLLPMFALGLAMAAVTVWVEHHHVGTKVLDLGLAAVERPLLAGQVVCFYLAKLLVPVNLTFIYPKWEVSSGRPWQYLAPAGVLAALLALWGARRRIGKAPLAAALIYLIMLFPALGFIDVYPLRFSWVADHFQYLAAAAPLAAFAALVTRLTADPPWMRWLAVPLIVFLGTLSWAQSRLYADRITLWQSVVERNPASVIARTNLASELTRTGRADEARAHTARALELDPRDDTAISQTAMEFLRRGQVDAARDTCVNAIRNGIDGYAIRYPLGMAELQLGRWSDAADEFRRVLSVRPNFALGHLMLAEALVSLDDRPGAIRECREALRIEPQHVQARTRLANLLIESGSIAEAIPLLAELVRQQPDDIRHAYNLALAYQSVGRTAEAEDLARRIVAAQPRLARARQLLGTVLMGNRRFEESIAELAFAAELDPASADIRVDLALALSAAGRRAEAERRCREALEVSPDHPDARALLRELTQPSRTPASAPAS